MSFVLPKPKSVTSEEVVLARQDWERIVSVLGGPSANGTGEDQDDIAAVATARNEDNRFTARIEAERGAPVETTIPIDVLRAKLDGAHPVRAWREHRGWTQVHLSLESGVGRDLIAQIETRRKNGSIETLSRLARVLDVPIESLTEDEETVR